jgi:hypothetical protein
MPKAAHLTSKKNGSGVKQGTEAKAIAASTTGAESRQTPVPPENAGKPRRRRFSIESETDGVSLIHWHLTQRAIAIHEAGHAVVALATGFKVSFVMFV